MDAHGLRTWERARREILDPAGIVTVGDVMALPKQDVDLDLIGNNESVSSRAKHLRELALPFGLLKYFVRLRAGQHDASLQALAATLSSRLHSP